jgi:hypothetical protein
MVLPEVIAIIESLGLPKGDFALHGSAPLLAYRLVDEINDLDIVSRGAAWEYATSLAPTQRGEKDDVVRPQAGVEIFNGWLGDDSNELIAGATVIEGVPFVSLEAVLRFKRRLNRPKDEKHIRLIEHYLESQR